MATPNYTRLPLFLYIARVHCQLPNIGLLISRQLRGRLERRTEQGTTTEQRGRKEMGGRRTLRIHHDISSQEHPIAEKLNFINQTGLIRICTRRSEVP